jgi:hypothetical protein
MESCTPVAKGRGADGGAGARGGRRGACHRAVSRGGRADRRGADERQGCIWERCGGDEGRHSSIRRTLEEEEARILHLEVSSPLPRWSGLEGPELSFWFLCSQGGANRPHPCAC